MQCVRTVCDCDGALMHATWMSSAQVATGPSAQGPHATNEVVELSEACQLISWQDQSHGKYVHTLSVLTIYAWCQAESGSGGESGGSTFSGSDGSAPERQEASSCDDAGIASMRVGGEGRQACHRCRALQGTRLMTGNGGSSRVTQRTKLRRMWRAQESLRTLPQTPRRIQCMTE